MTRTRKALLVAAGGLVGLAAITGIGLAQSRGDRPDCPGKIVCPITGELICRDQCPTVDRHRPDCPGRIICPITGKLVCKDRCPLKKKAAAASGPKAKVPPCCAKKGSS